MLGRALKLTQEVVADDEVIALVLKHVGPW
jgi:hypothetical protein